MTKDEKRFQGIIEKKCPPCFRKGQCMLLSSRHAGIELCLGPFKDEEDRGRKIKEDNEKEAKPKADIERLVRERRVAEYWLYRRLFEFNMGPVECDGDDENDN